MKSMRLPTQTLTFLAAFGALLLSPAAHSKSCADLVTSRESAFQATVVPAGAFDFYILATGPGGFKKSFAEDQDDVAEGVVAARKIEIALNSRKIDLDHLNENLISDVIARVKNGSAADKTLTDPKSRQAYNIITSRETATYSAAVVPYSDDWLRVVVNGPEGKKTEIGYSRDAKNLANTVLNMRRLEAALNNGDIKWSEVDDVLMGRLIDSQSAEGNSRAYRTVRSQSLTSYKTYLLPAQKNSFYLAITGPEGFKKELGNDVDSDELTGVAISLRKLQKALNTQKLRWSDVTETLLRHLSTPSLASAYVAPSIARAVGILEKIDL